MFYLVVILVAFFTNEVLSHDKDLYWKTLSSAKIVGGGNAQRHQFPYQISLQYARNGSFRHVCGGSILEKQWVVTAAHCKVEKNIEHFQVVAGMLELGEKHHDVQVKKLKEFIIHSEWTGGVDTNDIGLIHLDSPLEWTEGVKPLKIYKGEEEPTGEAIISGWGYLSSKYPVPPKCLQTTSLPLLSHKDCKMALVSLIGSHEPLDESQVCTGPLTGGMSSCNGDSGGPLVKNGELVGIVSWGINPCGSPGAPSVFTKPYKHHDFINKHLK